VNTSMVIEPLLKNFRVEWIDVLARMNEYKYR